MVIFQKTSMNFCWIQHVFLANTVFVLVPAILKQLAFKGRKLFPSVVELFLKGSKIKEVNSCLQKLLPIPE